MAALVFSSTRLNLPESLVDGGLQGAQSERVRAHSALLGGLVESVAHLQVWKPQRDQPEPPQSFGPGERLRKTGPPAMGTRAVRGAGRGAALSLSFHHIAFPQWFLVLPRPRGPPDFERGVSPPSAGGGVAQESEGVRGPCDTAPARAAAEGEKDEELFNAAPRSASGGSFASAPSSWNSFRETYTAMPQERRAFTEGVDETTGYGTKREVPLPAH